MWGGKAGARARAGPQKAAADGVMAGPARRAIESLESSGVSIPAAAKLELEKKMRIGEAGEEERQCSCALTVFILYLGVPPTVPETHEWDQSYKVVGGSAGGKIDITKFASYIKLHNKTTEIAMTLERALKSEERFADWLVDTMAALSKAGVPLASVRLMRIVLQAENQAGGVWLVKRKYLYGYFFQDLSLIHI